MFMKASGWAYPHDTVRRRASMTPLKSDAACIFNGACAVISTGAEGGLSDRLRQVLPVPVNSRPEMTGIHRY